MSTSKASKKVLRIAAKQRALLNKKGVKGVSKTYYSSIRGNWIFQYKDKNSFLYRYFVCAPLSEKPIFPEKAQDELITYSTGEVYGRIGGMWDVHDGCHGFSYMEKIGWYSEGIDDLSLYNILGSGSILDLSLQDIQEKVNEYNNLEKEARFHAPSVMGWRGNTLYFQRVSA